MVERRKEEEEETVFCLPLRGETPEEEKEVRLRVLAGEILLKRRGEEERRLEDVEGDEGREEEGERGGVRGGVRGGEEGGEWEEGREET